MTILLSNLSTRVDLQVVQGSTYGPVKHSLKQPDGSPVDLTGCTVRGQVRHLPADIGPPLANFECEIDPDPTLGVYRFGLTHQATSALPAGPRMKSPDSIHCYDIELVDATGRIVQTLHGLLTVQAGVTRAA